MKFIYKWMDELYTVDILLFTQSQTEGKAEEEERFRTCQRDNIYIIVIYILNHL